MDLIKCTFDELPPAMKSHIMFIRKIPVSEYRLAIWSEKDTLYYNDLKESEVKRFVTLIESEKRILNNKTMDSIYNKYGFAVYMEIHDAHDLSEPLLKAMSHLADKGRFKFKEWSTDQAYIYFMGYLLGSGKLEWEEQLL